MLPRWLDTLPHLFCFGAIAVLNHFFLFTRYGQTTASSSPSLSTLEQRKPAKIQPGGGIAISNSRVAVLVNAVSIEEDLNDKNRERHPFLLLFDRKGNLLHALPLDLPFHISEVEFFDSGELLLIGSAQADLRQHWAVVDENGRLQAILSQAATTLATAMISRMRVYRRN